METVFNNEEKVQGEFWDLKKVVIMANCKYNEPDKEKRGRLQSRINQLVAAKKLKGLELEDIEVGIKYCRKEIDRLGDFP